MGLPDEDGDSDDLEQQRLIPPAETHHRDDFRTPLDKTIDRIGMGQSSIPDIYTALA
jgi:hypothetical protein